MNDIAIKVEGLGKQYRLGSTREKYYSLRDSIMTVVKSPFRKLSRMNGKTGPENEMFWALKDVSFEVRQGEVLGIIGRNGAGKSTLLKILSRITEPTEGSAKLYGRVGSLLEVGTGFHPELTGRENIYLSGAILGMRKFEINRQFDEIVDFAGIEKFLDTPAKRYSSGMYVRLAFAVAAHLDPEILLIDEVLAVGDAEFQRKCLGKMGEVAKGGRTVFFVSHNMVAITSLCSRAILLVDGTKSMDGLSQDVVNHYFSSATSLGGEIVWMNPAKAPGHDRIKIHAVRVLRPDGTPAPIVMNNEETLLELSYWNFVEDAVIFPSFWVKHQSGAVVFTTSNWADFAATVDPWCHRPHPIGLFRSICKIPANFFNESVYSIDAHVVSEQGDQTVFVLDVIAFEARDDGKSRGDYCGPIGGIMRQKVEWSTDYVSPGQQTFDTIAND